MQLSPPVQLVTADRIGQRQISAQHQRDIGIACVVGAERFATQAVNVRSPKADVTALAVDLHAKHP